MYQEHLMTNKVELETELSNLAARRQQIQKMHPRHQNFHMNQAEVEGIFLNSSLDLVRKEAQKALEDFEQEQELAKAYSEGGSGVYQNQPAHLIASNYEFTTLPQSQQQQQQLEERTVSEEIPSDRKPSRCNNLLLAINPQMMSVKEKNH